MNAHVGQAQTLKFRAQSLLAYVLEPVEPLADWFEALDAWLARSPTFFIARPVILDMAALDIALKEYRDLLSGLARRHIRVMGAENVGRGLVGPHLPPIVSGGRPVEAPTLREDDAAARDDAPAPRDEGIRRRLADQVQAGKGQFAGRGCQRALRPVDRPS